MNLNVDSFARRHGKQKREDKKIESVSVEPGKKIEPSLKKDWRPGIHLCSRKDSKNARNTGANTTNTGTKRTKEEPNTDEEIERSTMSNNDRATQEIQMLPTNKTPEGNSANPIVSFEPASETMSKAFSDSMSILSESAKLLHEQNKYLLKSENPDVKKPGITEIEIARMNADTIARLVQVKVNMVKAVRS